MENNLEKQTENSRGLATRVARLTEFSLQYVDQVLKGSRNNDTISKCAELVRAHEQLSDELIKTELKAIA